ncbi:MAG: hypothetical protein R3258_04550 [Acidimicrobiia bacterium]|nr:hypothetical protein [Acidimicrobiia bacterium]
MSEKFPELDQVKITVDPATRDRHLAAIADAVRSSRRGRRPMRLLAVAATLVLLLPVMALAAERAVPGDLLYPIKQLFEPAARVFDSDISARHRVEEVETLLDRDAPSDVIHDHLQVARDTVTDEAQDDDLAVLTDRLDRAHRDLLDREREHDHTQPTDDGDDAPRHTETTTTTVAPTDSTRPPRDG